MDSGHLCVCGRDMRHKIDGKVLFANVSRKISLLDDKGKQNLDDTGMDSCESMTKTV